MLIDVPKDVGQGPCTAPFTDKLDLPGYTVPSRGDPERDRERPRDFLRDARRPVLYVGQGAVISDAGKAITALAEKLRAPVVNTLLGKGAVDETHPLHLGMLGMHGTAYANKAVADCDLHHGDRRALGRPHHRRVSRLLHPRGEDPRRHRPGGVRQDHQARRVRSSATRGS